MRATVAQTRLWKREKRAVAEELIAHFHDANEARAAALGDPPPPAEATFGNPDLTARLIRRAKLRNRSLIWHTWKWSRRVVGVFLLLYALLAIRFFWGKPQVKVDYLARLNAPILAVPEQDRAWPLYREAMLRLGLKQGQDPIPLTRFLPGEETSVRQPGQDHWPELAQALRDHADAIALLREAAARPAMGLPLTRGIRPEDATLFAASSPPGRASSLDPGPQAQPLLGVLLPQLRAMRAAARILIADTYCAAEEADGDRALQSLIAVFGMAGHAAEQPFLINGLVAVSLDALAFRTAGQLLREHPQLWDDRQLVEFAHRVAATNAAELIDFAGERAMMYDLIQKIYSDDGHGDGRLTDEGLQLFQTLPLYGLEPEAAAEYHPPLSNKILSGLLGPTAMAATASRRELTERYDQWMHEMERLMTAPDWQCAQNEIEAEVDELHRSVLGRVRYGLITTLMPAMLGAGRPAAIHDAQRDGLLVAIALELYRREHGGYPDPAAGLEVLVSRFLPEVPLGIGSGRPLRWTLRDGSPVVYDVGGDGDDDGGRAVDGDGQPLNNATLRQGEDEVDGDWVAYPIQER